MIYLFQIPFFSTKTLKDSRVVCAMLIYVILLSFVGLIMLLLLLLLLLLLIHEMMF